MRRKAIVVAALVVVAALLFALLYRPFPSDRTPEGAYVRIARDVGNGRPAAFFAYLEEEAQWACYTIREMRKKAVDRIRASYPEPQRTQMIAEYARYADAPDGSDVFALLYEERGWAKRLRRDLSGVVGVEVEGDRASVVTARGTRWPFRRRKNGIWGLTVFTAELVAESEKATRDLGAVEAAAEDYDRLRSAKD